MNICTVGWPRVVFHPICIDNFRVDFVKARLIDFTHMSHEFTHEHQKEQKKMNLSCVLEINLESLN